MVLVVIGLRVQAVLAGLGDGGEGVGDGGHPALGWKVIYRGLSPQELARPYGSQLSTSDQLWPGQELYPFADHHPHSHFSSSVQVVTSAQRWRSPQSPS